MNNFLCWLFGCEPDREEYESAPPGYELECKRCGCVPDYADLVGYTRWNMFKEFCTYWLFRKWIPTKCSVCGNRWRKCDEDNFDHIPF